MGAKIPRAIRIEVIRKWLQGESRDRISEEMGIGAGTVSGIIKEYKRDDPDADLLREVALLIKHQGMDIHTFAPLVRLREVLKRQEWTLGTTSSQVAQEEEDEWFDYEAEKKIESLIASLEVFCFKQNLTAKEFFDSIYEMYIAAQKLGILIEEFPDRVQELADKVETLTEDNRIARRELQELKVRNQKLTQQLVKVEKEARKYKIDLAIERELAEVCEAIDEEELEQINEDLGYGTEKVIGPSNLKEMLMDVYYHPTKHSNIVGELMRNHESKPKRRMN